MRPYYFGNKNAQKVLVQMVDDHDLSFIERETVEIQEMTGREDFLLAAVKADNWNDDLTPWRAPPVFGDEVFGNGAEKTLEYLTGQLLPSLSETDENPVGSQKRTYYIGGYSLSGLFALWAAYQTEIFSGAAAVSPSVWFPGFRKYALSNPLKAGAVYLSLGDREERTRNPVMSQVGDAIRAIYGHYDALGVPAVLEWNQGNHFKEPDRRTAKGFAWLLAGAGEKDSV